MDSVGIGKTMIMKLMCVTGFWPKHHEVIVIKETKVANCSSHCTVQNVVWH